MTIYYLCRPLRSLPEALADVRTGRFCDRDIDTLARALLSEDGYRRYEMFVVERVSAREAQASTKPVGTFDMRRDAAAHAPQPRAS
jgi:hypothetical protein